MTDLRQAAQQALDVLEEATSYTSCPTWSPSMTKECEAAVTALRTALEQQQQAEPVAWELRKGKTDRVLFEITNNPNRARDWELSLEEVVPLYTKQPHRKTFTDEQDRALCEAYCNNASDEYFKARPTLDFPEMRRIFYAGHRKAWIGYEAAHGIKENT